MAGSMRRQNRMARIVAPDVKREWPLMADVYF